MGGTTSFPLNASLTRAGLTLCAPRRPVLYDRWERKNHAGRAVALYAGPVVVVAAAVGAGRVRTVAGFAVPAAGACGAHDDVAGYRRRGVRAHPGALGDGEVTSGAVKLFGISRPGWSLGRCSRSGSSTRCRRAR